MWNCQPMGTWGRIGHMLYDQINQLQLEWAKFWLHLHFVTFKSPQGAQVKIKSLELVGLNILGSFPGLMVDYKEWNGSIKLCGVSLQLCFFQPYLSKQKQPQLSTRKRIWQGCNALKSLLKAVWWSMIAYSWIKTWRCICIFTVRLNCNKWTSN